MGYILPPEPSDDEVIAMNQDGTSYTWGQHRAMEKALAALEQSDPVVLEAKQRLVQTLEDAGIEDKTGVEVILICEHCGVDEIHVHQRWCPDFHKDASVTRTAGGYEYLDENFTTLHYTSAPANDAEAFDYFRIVEVMFDSETHVKYIKRRKLHESEYHILPVTYDYTTKEVEKLSA